MSTRVTVSTLNASTIDIINTIRTNASAEYQSMIPEIETEKDIPKVGELILGYPALANQFIGALVNRIAFVAVKSATFNNAYKMLKKGYLEFGETVEEVFVNIAKARIHSPEKAYQRELKRDLPDVKTAFHAVNWKVQYPITIEQEELRQAFLSINGVQDLIAKIVNSVYTAAEYDEFLLFKYLIIKAVANGKVKPTEIIQSENYKESASKFRGTSNKLTFMSPNYNEAGVLTTTPKDRQVIFMSSDFNAKYDVEVLASAFNIDKADFMGRLYLIDDFTTFDNDRFSAIRAESDGIDEVTVEELSLMRNVQAVIFDEEWFQVYDKLIQFTEKFVSSGLYWNYILHTWKIVSRSPFANAVSFVEGYEEGATPEQYTVEVVDKNIYENGTVLTFEVQNIAGAYSMRMNFAPEWIQTEEATEKGIGVHKYGVYMFPANQTTLSANDQAKVIIGGVKYYTRTAIPASLNVGSTFTIYSTAG